MLAVRETLGLRPDVRNSFSTEPAGLACHLVSALTGKRPDCYRTRRAWHFSPIKVHERRNVVLSARQNIRDGWAYHCPPRAVAMPRALSASAISRSVRAPAFCASRMIGSTFAAYLSASDFTASTALLRAKAIWSRELPSGRLRD